MTTARGPTSACVANLALSACKATVLDLDDCVVSLRSAQSAPFRCARYADTPGCLGTIVTVGSGDGCRLRIE